MWIIETTDTLDDTHRANVLASLIVLQGPYAGTVNGSCYGNMKELRVQSKGDPIRAFFAFDPTRRGILLSAGNKVGNEKRFYDEMIPIADREFRVHLERLKKE